MPSTTDDPTAHLPLHPETFRILLALKDRELHGYAIVKEMEADPERAGRVLPANLYRRIRSLRDQGLIVETPGPEDAARDDERRRYFMVTDRGSLVLRAEVARLRSLLAEADGVAAS